MTTFQKLFGIKETDVKKTCILMPLLKKDTLNGLGVKGFLRGRLYGAGNTKYFTIIHTGIGSALLGDAVLYLGETQCQDIILFGSCGLVREEKSLKVGSLVMPSKCYSQESFTEMLLGDKKDPEVFYPDKVLFEKFLRLNKSYDIKEVTCSTLGSLKLEEQCIDRFKEKDIQIVDMECSSLFSASGYVKKRAMALFYITDIINEKPFYMDLNKGDSSILSSSIKSAIGYLCKFIEKNLNG